MTMAQNLASSSLGTAPDTYLYTVARSGFHSTDNFATIGSDDYLRVFDSSLTVLHAEQSCHAGVSCLKPFPGKGFVTAGRDGLIRTWDNRAKHIIQFTEPHGRGISAIAALTDIYIAAGTESTKEGLGDVSILVFDTRNPLQPLRTYDESHTDSITQLAFHPTQSNVLLSASTDGLVSIFDINQSDEDEAIQQVLNVRSAVHGSGFLSNDQAYILTTDEHFSIHPLAEDAQPSDIPMMEFGDVRQKLDCMYVIDVFQQPDGKHPPVMAYGHNENQTLTIVQLSGGPQSWSFGQKVDLPGAHGEDVVRDLLLASDSQRAYTCGEDGQVKVWGLTGAATEPEASLSESAKSIKKRKGKSERFAPY